MSEPAETRPLPTVHVRQHAARGWEWSVNGVTWWPLDSWDAVQEAYRIFAPASLRERAAAHLAEMLAREVLAGREEAGE